MNKKKPDQNEKDIDTSITDGSTTSKPTLLAEWWDWVEEHWKSLSFVIGAIFLYSAYLAGVAYHQTRLSMFGIDEGMFARGKFEYLLDAAFVVLKNTDAVVGALADPSVLIKLLAFSGAAGITSFLWFWIDRARRMVSKTGTEDEKPRDRPVVKSVVINLLMVPLGCMYLFLIVPVLCEMVLIFPVGLGDSAAHRMVSEELSYFKAGCAAHVRGRRCVRVIDGSKEIATGFVIEESKDAIALWDNGIVKMFPATGKILESYDSVGYASSVDQPTDDRTRTRNSGS